MYSNAKKCLFEGQWWWAHHLIFVPVYTYTYTNDDIVVCCCCGCQQCAWARDQHAILYMRTLLANKLRYTKTKRKYLELPEKYNFFSHTHLCLHVLYIYMFIYKCVRAHKYRLKWVERQKKTQQMENRIKYKMMKSV